VAVEREQSPHVHIELRDQVVVGARELLNHVTQLRLDGRESHAAPQIAVGDNVNAGDLGAAEIEWYAVGFTMIERGEQAFSRVYGNHLAPRDRAPRT
jgi:hypothetical protein